jgi:hypothetical protein
MQGTNFQAQQISLVQQQRDVTRQRKVQLFFIIDGILLSNASLVFNVWRENGFGGERN